MKKCIFIILLVILFLPIFIDEVLALAFDLEIVGEGAVLIEQNTGKILYEKNKNEKMYPASTTKIMTGILALELGDLKEIVTIGEEIEIIPGDSSSASLFVNQKITLEELLYGLLLPSGNDAANSIAVHIAKKLVNDEFITYQDAIEVFVGLMNRKAKEIGAKNTNYVNPHGYHDDEHYTTPWDMAMITRNAMGNEKFREIVKSKFYTFKNSSEGIETDKQWKNYNELLQLNNKNYFPYANGVKTGRTTKAGRCLVSSATKDNLNLISVLFKSTEEDVWKDSSEILSFGIENFRYHTLANKNQSIAKIKVEKAFNKDKNELNVITNKKLQVLLNKADIPNIEKQLYLGKDNTQMLEGENINLVAPIEKGEVIGYVTYSINGEEILKEDLIANNTIRKRNIFITYWWLFALMLIAIIAIFVSKFNRS
jgi:D-alanyl-D-alanine carboxypeptidase (penicillin-binding protein 5/6)